MSRQSGESLSDKHLCKLQQIEVRQKWNVTEPQISTAGLSIHKTLNLKKNRVQSHSGLSTIIVLLTNINYQNDDARAVEIRTVPNCFNGTEIYM